MFKITGLDGLQKQLDEAAKAFEALDGELTSLRFDPADSSSVEAAVVQMEYALDAKIGPYRGNAMVESVAEELKQKYRQEIYDRAAAARLERESKVDSSLIDPSTFRQLENVVNDLQSSDSNNFDRNIKKLSRLLHSADLQAVTSKLIENVDLDAWLAAGEATQGGMIGSARLDWPTDQEKELGLIILLIDRFASDVADNLAFNVSYRFFYNGNNITNNLQHMTRQMIVPFVRDYINFVKSKTGAEEATLLPAKGNEPAARKIFVVHGHDEGAREAVARYVEKLGFEPIILHEQANQGRTIIEKIEAHSDVGFAVVLLTPDDSGSRKGDAPKDRARQNVVLELGYFVGRLGRSRVCALKRGEVEVPSDFGGVVYEVYDENGGWRSTLARELEAAGFEIDWNIAMRPNKR